VKIPKWRFIAVLALLSAPVLVAQTTPSWTEQFPQSNPAPRAYQSMSYDSSHGQIVLFGGQDFTGNVGYTDTWVWDGSTWTQKFPQHSPPAQSAHAMVYDSAHGQAVMFSLNDTWLWDGSNWTPVPPNGPSGRYGHAMAYDSAHSQVVLFGGADANNASVPTVLGDTWIWDGTDWTQKSPQTSPPPRFQHAMAYDSARGKVVLYGGLSSNSFSDTLGDTWVWDGANWTQESPQTSPPALAEHAMAFDSKQGQVVVFGGIGNGPPGDTWLWDGSNWTEAPPEANAPPPRSAQTMAYDSAHEQVVMFGGIGSGSVPVLGDIWTYGVGATQVVGPSINGVEGASGFGELRTVARGSWIEIYGSNLAPDARGWSSADFNGNTAPTSLDKVSVMIGGQAAFVDYISPFQVNALLPSNIANGELQLTVTNGGVTSAPVDLTVTAAAPGLLALSNFFAAGHQYLVAQLPDGTYVLPTGAISGINSRPAKPGETIVVYGIGFGAVTPPTPVGQIASGQSQLVLPLQVQFGGIPAALSYAGLSPDSVGLYQFNLTVPAIPDNDLVPFTFTLGGTPGMQTLFTAVHQ
jgi:uncharacterized protein (TIGR03437 family)